MKTLKLCLLLAALCVVALVVSAPRLPAAAADSAESAPFPANVPSLSLPAVDNAALLAEDALTRGPGIAPRFALPLPVRVSPATHGRWEALDAQTWRWRLRIVSPGALSLNLGFTTYFMPPDGVLAIYPTAGATGAALTFTAADNETHGQLWTPIVLTDDLIVEVTLPATQRADLRLNLTSVNHAYAEFGRIQSGACNVDVICSQGDLWRSEIRSVAVIGLNGSTFCTGFLVNNTANNLKPYFMTAYHCGVNAGNAASLVAYWNYENSYCRPIGSPENGGPGDGSLSQFQTGSFFRAASSPSDFTLVELDDAPSQAFNVHWAGWDATPADAASATAIHHPNTDEKRISFENDPTSTTSYLGNTVPGDGTHVRVTDWDLGTTEPGSSGSPLFNQDHRIVGQLHGGYAACGNNSSDWYGRVSVSWTGGGSNATRLSNWLDPLNLGVLVWDGVDQTPDFGLGISPAVQDACVGGNSAAYTVSVTSQSGFSDPVTLSSTYSGAFNPNPVIPPGQSLFNLNTSGLGAGSYTVDVTGASTPGSKTVNAALNVYAAAPNGLLLVAPPNGATNISTSPVFSWSANNATTYDLSVYKVSDGSLVAFVPGITTTSYTLTGVLQPTTAYRWHITAHNACGQAVSADFTFSTRAVPAILLVDDDDNNPDVRSFYAAAIQALGQDYDIWDTNNSDTEPDLTTLSQYDLVIWFSGDEFGGFAGPGNASESALAGYLDAPGQNCLLLVSQDYHYDRGQTAFMTNYLGVASASDDVGQTKLTGKSIYRGQSYTLSYPFTDYSDSLTRNGKGVVMFRGDHGNAVLARANSAQTYLTMFWATPWEAIPTAAERANVLTPLLDRCMTP